MATNSNNVDVYDPQDVLDAVARFRETHGRCQCAILDPWYNKGVGGVRDDYVEYMSAILAEIASVADHVYFWGFPEIVALFMERLPKTHEFVAWLTWYYKNNPSVIRGWRSAQQACIHIKTPDARMYPEHFLNEAQLEKKAQGKLRYMPGPTSVIESSLLVGFVGRKEQTGHKSQKPVPVYEQIIRMATTEGDLVFDPMCGSGTTGEVCLKHGRRAVLNDIEPEYVEMTRNRMERCTPEEPLQAALI
ncbi:site-specific DNA-methyltransferase [Paracoccus sp. SCSIO 75233]|uniref:DNA-methyltransferase n=1 Tax=Paracoccus sp. SCSIO 75233 TaxID=3017782 RepID=UPI0022EFF053|nr:site-specific DNA-methyltransferase [Paracoccus sp. SCSIO 75233]WBU54160.1 site-specific DNA-methyltransferase [Paracoccus sp. SCSIO 75233]